MMTIIRYISALILAGFSSFLLAQEAAPNIPTEKALLWQISHSDLTDTSYLYGTIHMIPEESYFLTESTRTAFDRSSTIAFEIDTEAMMNPTALMGLMGKMNMTDGSTLKSLLSEDDYKIVADHFEKMGLPMGFLGRIKPMFLTVLAGQSGEGGSEGFDPSQGFNMLGEGIKSYELEFTEMAKTAERPITGLETAEFQMSLFDSIPYPKQAEMLVETIQTGAQDDSQAMMDRMVNLYLSQDIVAMEAMMDEEGGIAGFEDLLLHQRNHNWIPVMADLMGNGTVFFAVGAGHLAGEQGVIALLREKGYRVTAVEPME